MLWGCFSFKGSGSIVHGIMDSRKYQGDFKSKSVSVKEIKLEHHFIYIYVCYAPWWLGVRGRNIRQQVEQVRVQSHKTRTQYEIKKVFIYRKATQGSKRTVSGTKENNINKPTPTDRC